MLPLCSSFLSGVDALHRTDEVEVRGRLRRIKRPGVIASIIGLVTLWLVFLNGWLLTCGFEGCPSAAEIRAYRPPDGGRVLDRHDRPMGRLYTVKRVNITLATVPKHVRDAFIATEDRRFYQHNGLDWRGVARAVWRNARSGRVREGFSTITMQVARNTFLAEQNRQQRTVGRKLLELRLARLLERHLTKEQILQLYLNAIYLGNGVYGVEAASRDLFGKGVRQLSVSQGAMLAALPKGPSLYTPRRDARRALERRNLVLSLMEREGFLSSAQTRAARRERLVVSTRAWRPPLPYDSHALDLVRALVDSVARATRISAHDLVVHTTIDVPAQRAAERAVGRRAAEIERETTGWYDVDGERPGVEGAMVAIDPATGEIRALVGSRRYVRGSFNRAVAARRQPGSAFKPFVYAAALSAGFTPASVIDDEPVVVDQGTGNLWTPANYGDEYAGPVTMRRALMRSANAATVRISRAIGEHRVVEAAHRNGITSDIPVVPAVALGAVDVSPLELVSAYAPFANSGYRVRPRLVRRIETRDGIVVWQSSMEREQAMDPRDAFLMTSMLRGVVDGGTGSSIRSYGVSGPVAGKTGTTNDGTDVWFVGYTPTLVAGFWFGYDIPRSLGSAASGGRLAAPAWARFYREGWRERNRGWEPPGGVVAVTIDAETGALANEWCPIAVQEWFKMGTEPTSPCYEHDGPVFETWIDDFHDRIGRRIMDTIRRIRRPPR